MNQKSIYMDNETFEKIKSKALIVDVRSDVEYKSLDKFDNSINVYVYDLIANPTVYLPDKQQLIVTVCNGGNRSSQAADDLRQAGYENAYVLEHGIFGYRRWKK